MHTPILRAMDHTLGATPDPPTSERTIPLPSLMAIDGGLEVNGRVNPGPYAMPDEECCYIQASKRPGMKLNWDLIPMCADLNG